MKDTTDSLSAVTNVGADEPVHVRSEAHLQDLIRESHVLLVDFYADWCGPCKMLKPIVERLAAETDATVAKVDIDRLQNLAEANNVQGVPTMFLYVDGELREQLVGLREESTLREFVTDHT